MKNPLYLLLFLVFPLSVLAQEKVQKPLPEPFATKPVSNCSNVIGWKAGETPKAPEGFVVTKYADGFENPRWMYVTPNGDVLVAQSNSKYSILKLIGCRIIVGAGSNKLKNSADGITLLRGSDQGGLPDRREVFLTKKEGLIQPFGMLILGDWLYVAN